MFNQQTGEGLKGSLLDVRNLQVLQRQRDATCLIMQGGAIGPAFDRLKAYGDDVAYCLDAPSAVPTGSVMLSRTGDGRLVNNGNGWATPALCSRLSS